MQQTLLFENFFAYKFPQPQYLGAKYKHLTWIGKNIPANINTVLDAFSGAQSVAFYFKQLGYQIFTNDFLNFNNQIGKSLIENKNIILEDSDIEFLFSNNSNIEEFNFLRFNSLKDNFLDCPKSPRVSLRCL